MSSDGCILIIGGTEGLGNDVARHYAAQGMEVVISGRDAAAASEVAKAIGGNTRGIAVDLAQPQGLRAQLSGVGQIRYLVITPILRDNNTVRDFNIDGAMNLVTMKLVGYAEAIHVLLDRLDADSSIVIFGGLAKERPYPGSTTVSTVNGGIVGLLRTLTIELAPMRINAIHPGVVSDSPYWSGKDHERFIQRTPLGRLAVMAEITDAVRFLLENTAVNGTNLYVDGGWTTT
jgi:NAD(P)-dependent dehydrogenase (short-subunit alcohol dehydrogenase family)